MGLLWGPDENNLLNILAQHKLDAQHIVIESKFDFWKATHRWRKFANQLFIGSNFYSISNSVNLDKFLCSLIIGDNDIYLTSPLCVLIYLETNAW